MITESDLVEELSQYLRDLESVWSDLTTLEGEINLGVGDGHGKDVVELESGYEVSALARDLSKALDSLDAAVMDIEEILYNV